MRRRVRLARRWAAGAAVVTALATGAACASSGGGSAGPATTTARSGAATSSGSSAAAPSGSPAPTTSAASGSAAPSAADTSSPAGPAQRITVDFTGDMLPSDALDARAHADAGGHGYDFRPMLRNVAPILRRADWAICHQETPVSDNDVGISGYPAFNGPYELAAAEHWAGYDACDTASNHTVDLGAGGIAATLGTLDRFHIQHSGSATRPGVQPPIYDVDGVHIGHLAYTYGLNGISPPHPWSVNLIDPARIRADAHTLKQRGADIVIVSMHMGTEKDPHPSDYQRQMAAAVMRSPDVDLIVGAHAHVVQPVQRLSDGRWIIYGLGNFLAQQDIAPGESATPPHRDGVIMQATFTREHGRYTITQMGYVPTFVNAPSDVVELAPAFSRARTVQSLTAMGAPLVDLTPH